MQGCQGGLSEVGSYQSKAGPRFRGSITLVKVTLRSRPAMLGEETN